MRRTLGVASLLLTTAGWITATGCGSGSGKQAVPAPLRTVSRGQYRDLRCTLELPKTTFAVGEAVRWRFRVENAGAGPVDLTLGSSTGQGGRYTVEDATGRVVVAASGSLTDEATVTIGPGETREYVGQWGTASPFSTPQTSGTYTVRHWVGANTYNGEAVPDSAVTAPPLSFVLR